MSEIVETEFKSIGEILSGVVYKLDHYQRNYEWERKHVHKLIDDLTETFERNFRPSDNWEKVSGYSTYFLGNIILFNDDVDSFIIDGQQRLTSLTLLLLYLRSELPSKNTLDKERIDALILTEKDGTKSFNLNFGDQDEFLNAIISGLPFDPNGKSLSVINMHERYNDIKLHLQKNLLTSNKLPIFLEWLIQRVKVVEIITYSEQNAYSIFEVTNDRGLRLRPHDLLKSYLLSKVSISQKQLVAEKWNKTVRFLNEYGTGNSAECIKAWLHSKYARSIGNGNNSATRKDFENINSMYHVWFQRTNDDKKNKNEIFGLNQSSDFVEFMDAKFKFFAQEFIRIQEASKTMTEDLIHVRYISQLVDPFPYMILLSPINPDDSSPVRGKKIDITAKFIEIFLIRKMWKNNNSTDFNTFQKPMFKIVQDIRDFNLEQLRDYFRENLKEGDYKFSKVPVLAKQKGNINNIRHILARLTEFIEVKSKQESNYEKYVNYGFRENEESFDVEHIWHKNEPHKSALGEIEFERKRNSLGGLLLLPSSVNSTVGDKPYEEKLECYYYENLLARSLHPECYERTSDFNRFCEKANLPFKPYNEFGVKEIEERNELYCQIAEKIWNSDAFND